jgi:hypothetical protein
MKEVKFRVPHGCDLRDAEKKIERICAGRGLTQTMKGSQSKFPGCVHWHYKNGSQRGTLELTLWREENRIWATVQEGRKAEWIDGELPRLKKEIEQAIAARKG